MGRSNSSRLVCRLDTDESSSSIERTSCDDGSSQDHNKDCPSEEFSNSRDPTTFYLHTQPGPARRQLPMIGAKKGGLQPTEFESCTGSDEYSQDFWSAGTLMCLGEETEHRSKSASIDSVPLPVEKAYLESLIGVGSAIREESASTVGRVDSGVDSRVDEDGELTTRASHKQVVGAKLANDAQDSNEATTCGSTQQGGKSSSRDDEPLTCSDRIARFNADCRRRVKELTRQNRCVLIFAIPLRKRDSREGNLCWGGAEVVESDGTTWRMEPAAIDVQNHDRIFILQMEKKAETSFYLKCPTNGDVDRPTAASYYRANWNLASVFSLRDGILAPDDMIFETGIMLRYLDRCDEKLSPRLHFWHEITGCWSILPFLQSGGSTANLMPVDQNQDTTRWICSLPGVRRCLFVVELQHGVFLKSEGQNNFLVSFPGCYDIFDEGYLERGG